MARLAELDVQRVASRLPAVSHSEKRETTIPTKRFSRARYFGPRCICSLVFLRPQRGPRGLGPRRHPPNGRPSEPVELHNRDPSGEAALNRVFRADKSHAFAHRFTNLHRYSPVCRRPLAAARWQRNPPLLRQSRPLANGTRMILAPNHGLRRK